MKIFNVKNSRYYPMVEMPAKEDYSILDNFTAENLGKYDDMKIVTLAEFLFNEKEILKILVFFKNNYDTFFPVVIDDKKITCFEFILKPRIYKILNEIQKRFPDMEYLYDDIEKYLNCVVNILKTS